MVDDEIDVPDSILMDDLLEIDDTSGCIVVPTDDEIEEEEGDSA